MGSIRGCTFKGRMWTGPRGTCGVRAGCCAHVASMLLVPREVLSSVATDSRSITDAVTLDMAFGCGI
ncbi:hypothetical protein MTO96_051052 [Rhipicephalus appendiculatus]